MDKLGVFVWFAVAVPLSTIANAYGLSCIWRWFMSAEYGRGPSLGAWFGLSIIAVLLTVHLPHRSMPEQALALWRRSALQLGWLCALLAVVYGVGAIFEWIS